MNITKKTPQQEILTLSPPCKCSDCTHGCRMGSGILAKGDVLELSKFLNLSIEETKAKYLEETEQFNQLLLRPKILRNNKPYGQCIFFKEGFGCTVHEAKPLQCKIAMGCTSYGEELMGWFMLNHIINEKDPESIRQYAAYLSSGGAKISGGSIEEMVPDKLMRERMLNFTILK